MRIFATKWFARFAKKNRMSDVALAVAVDEIENGNIDADLGGGIVKKRIARQGGGKSAGFRTIIAYKKGRRAIFLYGFPKNAADNVDQDDLRRLKKLAGIYAAFSEEEISAAVIGSVLIEVMNEEES